jgi:tRNA pseudouridine55 synthase
VSPVAGIAAISKPAGITSFAALFPIKRRLGTGKVGHAGTLDRFATGLLVVLAGPYSRLCPAFSSLDKTYVASVLFGEETDTLDPEGTVIARAAAPGREAIEAVLPSFRGPIMQAPPAYSALHLDGERAYEKALRGEAVEMKERPVVIHELELVDYDGIHAVMRVCCSSGTYIRSLARDIALAAGSRARLETLKRLSIGPLSLAESVRPDDFDPERNLRHLDPGLATALGYRPRMLASSAGRRFVNGGLLSTEDFADIPEAGMGHADTGVADVNVAGARAPSAVFSASGAFLGVVEEGPDCIRYRFVMPEER